MKRLFVIGGLIVALGIGFFFGIQIQAKRSSTKHTSELQALERVHQEESAGHASELQALEKISQAETSKLALAEQQADLLKRALLEKEQSEKLLEQQLNSAKQKALTLTESEKTQATLRVMGAMIAEFAEPGNVVSISALLRTKVNMAHLSNEQTQKLAQLHVSLAELLLELESVAIKDKLARAELEKFRGLGNRGDLVASVSAFGEAVKIQKEMDARADAARQLLNEIKKLALALPENAPIAP